MSKSLLFLLGAAAVAGGTYYAVSQSSNELDLNGLEPEAKAFEEPIAASTSDELTIVSFNIRDMSGRERTLEDFQELAKMIDGADIVVLQEMGAKAFKKSGENEELTDRLEAATEVLKTYLGDEWQFVFAETATPEEFGGAAEIPCVGFRSTRAEITINASWAGYYDLGEARDMGTFTVTCSKGADTEVFTLGTLHTKPTCPQRGYELLKVADYIDAHEDDNYILMGDFNWGYYSTCTNRYEGEERILAQHEDGKVYQVFNSISYTGKGKSGENFRTNLNVRSTPQMYDQFFLCKNYADVLAEGGSLGEDCGFVSFSNDTYFKSRVDDVVREQLKGVKAYMRAQGFKSKDPETVAALELAEEEIRSSWLTNDEASYKMSDHKPIWMRIDLFE
ncbi:MAG: hypothetical protein Crog4KO_29510 [Crocinitomicaceae bacterium]